MICVYMEYHVYQRLERLVVMYCLVILVMQTMFVYVTDTVIARHACKIAKCSLCVSVC